jgi:L-lactate dehydrogenase complex protein LldF
LAEVRTREFKNLASDALADDGVQKNLGSLYNGFNQGRLSQAAATPNWEEMRERARRIKTHTIENLDYYLDMAATNVEKAGGKVFFARDSETASQYILDLAKRKGVRSVIKGKSMLSEEMDLNQRLAKEEIEAIETDLGEYLVQLADQTPYHIIAPAIHMSKSDVNDIFHEKLGTDPNASIDELAGAARDELREKFIEADMSITGANFVVAETGTLVLVTNEGNGRMSTSMPKTHVAIMGMEKIVPSMEDMGTFLRLLIRSATGQKISSYVTMVTGPRTEVEEDGPEEFHLVIVDNGRSKLLADPRLREALNCIRCGACLNACPVYSKVGGHAYGWVYSGPIGAVISPVLTNVSDAKDLPYASSLCGACKEACPVKIDLPRMLLYLRSELTEGNTDPTRKNSSWIEKLAMKGWRLSVSNRTMLGIANRLGRIAQWPIARKGRLRRLPPPLSGWTRYRSFPSVSSSPFRSRWKKNIKP